MVSHAPHNDTRHRVETELEAIVRSEAFRNSRQSERLLRYLVQQTLDEHDDLLREKQVGVAVFDREVGYDTTTDPIVRVRVNEIRKRLAQYYQTGGGVGVVRFEVPSGCYRVKFVMPEVEAERKVEPAPRSARRRIPWYAYVAFVLTGALAVSGLLLLPPAKGAVENFWEPALRSPEAVILCSGHPVVYRLTHKYWVSRGLGPPDHFRYQTIAPKLVPGDHINWDDIVAIPDQYIGLGSAFTIARISAFLARQHKDSEIRFGDDISFTDLKKSPAVLIGAFSNRWALEMTRERRFAFETIDGAPSVRDRQTGKTWVLPGLQEDGRTNEDYLIVTRILRSKTGRFVVTAAGITQYGTQTAGDLLTNANAMEDIARRLPSNWKSKNLQLLLHVPIIGQSPGTPALIATQVW